MLNLQSLAFKISLVRSLASLGLSYNKQMNANPLHLLGNVTFLEVLAWWVFWLKCFPVCLDKKNLAWPSFVLFIGQYISCLICPHIHIFIHHIICSVGVCVCACALTTQSQKTLHLSASKMIGYLFFILPSYVILKPKAPRKNNFEFCLHWVASDKSKMARVSFYSMQTF